MTTEEMQAEIQRLRKLCGEDSEKLEVLVYRDSDGIPRCEVYQRGGTAQRTADFMRLAPGSYVIILTSLPRP